MTDSMALIDGGASAYGAASPNCPGCTAMGGTVDDAIRNADEAVREWMADRMSAGVPAPVARPADAILASPDAKGLGPLILAAVPLFLDER